MDGTAPPGGTATPVVLLGHDGTPGCSAAESWAIWLQRAFGARLHVAVAGAVESGSDRAAMLQATFGHGAPGVSVARVASRLRVDDGEATLHRAPSPAGSALVGLDARLEPAWLVLGSHGRGRTSFESAHSVLADVKPRVRASILVAREAEPDAVVAAYDGTRAGEAAGFVAAEWAQLRGLPFRLLAARDVPPPPALAWAPVERFDGEPGAALVAWSRVHPASLLVLGSRGRTGAERLHMGSVSDRVAALGHGNVLIARTARMPPVPASPRTVRLHPLHREASLAV